MTSFKRTNPDFRFGSLRRTQREQMSSELPLKADIAQYSRHVSKVPTTDIPNQFDSPVNKPPDGKLPDGVESMFRSYPVRSFHMRG